MKKKALIIEAHSDDSCISVGGFLSKFMDKYEYHFVVIAVSDIHLHHYGNIDRASRLQEYENYVNQFNGIWHRNKTLPFDSDSRLDRIPKTSLVSAIEEVIDEVKPDTLICQGPSFHHDHTLVYEAVIAATRPTARFIPNEIYVMENPTYVHSLGPSTDFNPDLYCQLTSEELEKKIDIFQKCFPSQIREGKNSLSKDGIRTWARYRGIESGCEYAEALSTYIRVI